MQLECKFSGFSAGGLRLYNYIHNRTQDLVVAGRLPVLTTSSIGQTLMHNVLYYNTVGFNPRQYKT